VLNETTLSNLWMMIFVLMLSREIIHARKTVEQTFNNRMNNDMTNFTMTWIKLLTRNHVLVRYFKQTSL